MDLYIKKSSLNGSIEVPGSKSHTIRAVILAAMADGVSEIANPLTGEDCMSALSAIRLMGAEAETSAVWKIRGAGKNLHLPSDVVHVGNSGSVLYFLSPIAATFAGWSVFTGDESIRTRPVQHLADALRQAGAQVHISRPCCNAPPLLIQGPIRASSIRTDGRLSQYISGFMMAATLLNGTTNIELTDPKETAYLFMTKSWLEKMGACVYISENAQRISVSGPHRIQAFNVTIPSDWEAVAFPLIAALITESSVVIKGTDLSGSQCDGIIVPLLQLLGGDIRLDTTNGNLTVCGGKRLAVENRIQRHIPPEECALYSGTAELERFIAFDKENGLHINCSSFPDAVCALAVIACFTEGTIVLEDIAVCRSKETDRIRVMAEQLKLLGANTEEGPDFLTIHGCSPLTRDGLPNPAFALHGGKVQSYKDHRIAMSLACLGLALRFGEELTVADAECCTVSFPGFIEKMSTLGADFTFC